MILDAVLRELDPQGQIDPRRAAAALATHMARLESREMGRVLDALQGLAERWLAQPEPVEPYEVVPLLVVFTEEAARRAEAEPGDPALRQVLLTVARSQKGLLDKVAASEASFGIPPGHFSRAGERITGALSRAQQAWDRHRPTQAQASKQTAAPSLAPRRVAAPLEAEPPVCPYQKMPLERVALGAATVWSCPSCRCMWIDKSQLSVIYADPQAHAARLAPELPARLANWLMPSPLPCLRCGQIMERTGLAGMDIDVCFQHGTWFDPGELAWVLGAMTGNAPKKPPPAKDRSGKKDRSISSDDLVEGGIGVLLLFLEGILSL